MQAPSSYEGRFLKKSLDFGECVFEHHTTDVAFIGMSTDSKEYMEQTAVSVARKAEDDEVQSVGETFSIMNRSADENSGEHTLPLEDKLATRDNVIFLCAQCKNIFGDCLAVCGEEKELRVIILVAVTKNVKKDSVLQFGVKGRLLGCVYKHLVCSGCGDYVGISICSSTDTLAQIRDYFLLFKEKVNCYVFQLKEMVPASDMEFSVQKYKNVLAKLQLEASLMEKRLTALEKRANIVISEPAENDLKNCP
ncbi:MS18B protein, partial [Polypterus senegalus]|nr:protein Mis18-beta [Polypterus senegalus]MBN3292614.1 MS18B protein [Polypterus senegalus]